MIVIDASALVAMLLDEPERATFFKILGRAQVSLSPVGYWEAAIKLEQQRGLRGVAELDALLSDFDIHIVAADSETSRLAVEAQRLFGKRTPTKLNMGDCFAYALAKTLNAPLLFKGDDFTQTDITPALPA